jgi:uncharacterized membrane protein
MGGLTDEKAGRGRLDSIDLLRGVVMVIMALDHVRGHFSNALGVDPVDLDHSTPGLFLTRWITHYCAPTFIFLAGVAAFLYGSHGKTKRQLSWFLLTRGLWLALLEITLIRWSWNFNFDYYESGAGVMWAIGWSMVILSGLVYLPTSAVATIGIAIIALHNLFDVKTAEAMHLPDWLWSILHRADKFYMASGLSVSKFPEELAMARFQSGYAVLPWAGVMAAGYGLGAIFLLDQQTRRRQLLGLGIVLTLLFVGLRYSNIYGDPPTVFDKPQPKLRAEAFPGPWSEQPDRARTVLSFLNCTKYPPSLMFLLMTLGPAIIALGLFDRTAGPIGRFFITYGRVPMFFYLLHLPLIHALAAYADYYRFGRTAVWSNGSGVMQPDDPASQGYGFELPMLYLIWAGVVLFLFPFCWWYAGFKRRHRWAWLSYF